MQLLTKLSDIPLSRLYLIDIWRVPQEHGKKLFFSAESTSLRRANRYYHYIFVSPEDRMGTLNSNSRTLP